jgi:hypothetical protein
MKNHQFELIKGVFDSSEAKEILLNVIDGKIQFHNDRIFSENIRLGTKNIDSINRVKELKLARKQVLEVLLDTKVSITSNITVQEIAQSEVA